MKIVYIIKKGLQVYPPCLMNILKIYDKGIKVEVYHGKNTEYINNILDEKKIKHKTIRSDYGMSRNKLEGILRYIVFMFEINKIVSSLSNKDIIWFGNETSLCGMKKRQIKNRIFVSSVLELNDKNYLINYKLKELLKYAYVICCADAHRSQIMRSNYKLLKNPYVIYNKPYEFSLIETNIHIRKDKLSILYQGVLDKDRPIAKFIDALRINNREDIVLYIMGSCSDSYKNSILKMYNNVVFLGYIPSPEHLAITQQCDIGLLCYDYSNLNNVFCAPNKIFEYSRFGKPMISSDNISLEETIDRNKIGKCVNFNDADNINSGLNEVLKNYNLFSKNSLFFYNSISNDYVFDKIIEKIENCIKE